MGLGFCMIPLATTREWIVDPKLSGLRMPLLLVGAFAPFVAAFTLSLRDFTLNLFTLLDPKVSTLHQVTWMYYTGLLALSALVVALMTKRVGFEAVHSRSADQ